MKKTPKNLNVSTGTVDDFFERSRNRARKLDRGEKLPVEMRLTFEDPADMLRALTAQRVRVLCSQKASTRFRPCACSQERSYSRKADIKILTLLELLTIHEEKNPGPGRRKIVEPLASKYELVATI